MRFMLDTNAYNQLLDSDLSTDDLKGEFFTTHIPEDELNNTTKEERRKNLNAKFKEIHQKELPTESAVWDVSRWDKAKWTDSNTPTEYFVLGTSRLGGAKLGEGISHNKILGFLEKIKPKDRGNIKDALIGETATKQDMVLVTDDYGLFYAVTNKGMNCKVMNFHAFIEVLYEKCMVANGLKPRVGSPFLSF